MYIILILIFTVLQSFYSAITGRLQYCAFDILRLIDITYLLSWIHPALAQCGVAAATLALCNAL